MVKPLGSHIGPYEILGLIGVGGMGEVYRARDMRLGRDVAIKFLPEEVTLDHDRRVRFEREARHLASLSHAHIAAIYGLEESTEGAIGLVLELVEGPTLAERLHGGALPVPEALRIAAQVAEALAAAHEAGIVHRDLKPANIKLKTGGGVKVLDFGLAKSLGGGAATAEGAVPPTVTSGGLTRAGTVLGTPAYMSPEQTRGGDVDRRADVWAFGCVLYEILTGRPAFPGDNVPDTIAAVLRSEPDWGLLPADLPPGVLTLLRRCLEKDPARRLRDLGDASVLIEDSASRPELSAPREVVVSAAAARRRLGVVAVAGAVVLAIGAAIAGFYFRSSSGPVPGASVLPERLPNSIAVLPLENLSADTNDAYFAAGLHEEILTQLKKLTSLTVITRSSVLRYAENRPPLPVIAEELRVEAVMEGSVRYAGDELMVTAQLIDPATGAQLWSEPFRADRGNVEQLFAIQIEIATNIARALGTEITAEDRGRIDRIPTESAGAYARYLRAREASSHGRFTDELRDLDTAIELDPEFADAYAQRAYLYAYGQITSAGRTMLLSDERLRGADFGALALADATRALELDDGAAFAWLARAVTQMFRLRYREANNAFARALALSPSDPSILAEYAQFRAFEGNLADATTLVDRALQSDPNGPVVLWQVAQVRLVTGRRDEAIAVLAKALTIDPGHLSSRMVAAVLTADPVAAEQHARAAEQLAAADSGWALIGVANVYRRVGLEREAQAALDRYAEWASAQGVGAAEWAQYYLVLGEMDLAYEWLEKTVEKLERGEADAGFVPLQASFLTPATRGAGLDPRLAEPRFRGLLDRLKALTLR